MDFLPLNLFQRLVRSWEAVHPYNAAQVLKLSGTPDVRSVNAAWHQSLHNLGLGRVRIEGQAFAFESLNGQSDQFSVRELPAGTCLPSHLGDALNVPFDNPGEPPFRPFIILGDDTFHLGVIYQHWVADSVSVRMLLREWFGRLYDPALLAKNPPRRAPKGYWTLFGPSHSRLATDEVVLGLLRRYIRFRTVQKVCLSGVGDYPVRVLLKELPTDAINVLLNFARSQNATMSDVLQAALAMACHRHLPMQRRPDRRDLAIGSIVDLRPHAGSDLSSVFGLYLGFTHVICRRANLTNFPALLRSISLQNRVHKRDGIAQSSLAWMLAAHIGRQGGKPAKLYRFYRKEIPLAAGLSNVNLAGTWADHADPARLLDYMRVSPTGPMAPLVLSVTTLRNRMTLAFTWRPSLLNEVEADDLARDVVGRLMETAAWK